MTIQRYYEPNYTRFGITRERYRELLNFCRQYPQWQAELRSLSYLGAQQYSDMPHGTDVGDPVARMVERRDRLREKIDLVERVARTVDGGRWYAALIQHVCMNRPLHYIDQTLLPTANRNAFYEQRKAFFVLLNIAREEKRD